MTRWIGYLRHCKCPIEKDRKVEERDIDGNGDGG